MMFYILACALALGATASEHVSTSSNAPAVAPLGDGPVKRGAALGSSPRVPLDSIIRNPDAFAGKSVTVEGLIGAVCTRKGCWMEISSKKDAKGVRVTFKDYGFFVPTDSKGMRVLAEGIVSVNTMSKEDVEHMESEGATVDNKQPDGTAIEIAFVATGVELRKK